MWYYYLKRSVVMKYTVKSHDLFTFNDVIRKITFLLYSRIKFRCNETAQVLTIAKAESECADI